MMKYLRLVKRKPMEQQQALEELNIWPPKLKTYFSIVRYRPAGIESWV